MNSGAAGSRPVRRVFSAAVLFLALLPAALPGTSRAAEDGRRPNIILFLMDDLRWDTLGFAGNPIVRTPNLDRLAAGGLRFTNAFATTSICYSSRASILTGQYERRHRIGDFGTPLSREAFAQTFPALLRKHGYRTGFTGKWGLGGALPKDEYDYWTGFPGQGRYYREGRAKHMTDHLTSQGLEFLQGCSAEKPFCLQVSFKAAHCQDGDPWPFQPARRFNGLYQDVRVPAPVTATEAHFQALPDFLRVSEARQRWYVRFKNDELYQKSVKDYYRLITGVDEGVGKMLAKLKERGLEKNTVILFSSDQGFYLGEHGLAGKWFMHEESIRIPLMLYDPRLPPARVDREIHEDVLNIDIAPTLLDLAGIPVPDVMQGRSLKPLMEGQRVAWRDDWFYEHLFQHARIPKSEGVRTSRWKYVRYIEREPVHEELFDLQNDPHETRNLAGKPENARVVADLRERWKSFRENLK